MGHTTVIEEFVTNVPVDINRPLAALTSLETKGPFNSFADISDNPP